MLPLQSNLEVEEPAPGDEKDAASDEGGEGVAAGATSGAEPDVRESRPRVPMKPEILLMCSAVLTRRQRRIGYTEACATFPCSAGTMHQTKWTNVKQIE